MDRSGGDKWADVLRYVVFCYNTGFQDTVRQTPFFLVYGRDPVFPLDVVYGRLELAELRDASDYSVVVHENLNQARKLAAKHIKLAQQKQKSYFDRGRKDVTFEKGQLVLLKTPPVGIKATRRFTGPHRIVSRLSPVNYEIELMDGTSRNVVHVEKLKPYLTPIAEFAQPLPED